MQNKRRWLTELRKYFEAGKVYIPKNDLGLLFEFALYPANFPWDIEMKGKYEETN